MQDYIDLAEKNGVVLLDQGNCQFCGAKAQRGIHECMEIFNLGFQNIDYSLPENHYYRFLIVDAHTLQHPEVHGRWNNHFHLTRLRLMFEYEVSWTYALSPKLSDCLNIYKKEFPDEKLCPPEPLQRGSITSSDIQIAKDQKSIIVNWAKEVYEAWSEHHSTVDKIALRFLKKS